MQHTSHRHHVSADRDHWDDCEWYGHLRAKGPQQAIIQRWCQKFVIKPGRYAAFVRDMDAHFVPGEGLYQFEDCCEWIVNQTTSSYLADPTKEVAPLNSWEYVLIHIAGYFCWHGLSDWDKAPMELRKRHAEQVAKHARALAQLMETAPHPDYLSVYALFDDEQASSLVDVCRQAMAFHSPDYPLARPGSRKCAQEQLVDELVWFLGDIGSRDRHVCLQKLPPILRHLAQFAENRVHDDQPEKRPSTNAEVRAFARHLSKLFAADFHRQPDEVFAACVTLRFPDYSNPGDLSDAIRRWRGAK